MFQSILMVCVGNICRSPFAEKLFQRHFPDKTISSAGLQATLNCSVPEFGINTARQYNVDLLSHLSKQLSAALCDEADLILVMEERQLMDLCAQYPQARGKVFLLGKWLKCDIPDPYRQSVEAFEHSYRLISNACETWQSKL